MRGGGNPTPETPRRRLPELLCAAIVPRAAINFRSSFWRCSEEVDCGGAGAAPRGLATAVNVDTKGGGGGGGAAPRGAGRGGVGGDLEGGDAFAAVMRRCSAATLASSAAAAAADALASASAAAAASTAACANAAASAAAATSASASASARARAFAAAFASARATSNA